MDTDNLKLQGIIALARTTILSNPAIRQLAKVLKKVSDKITGMIEKEANDYMGSDENGDGTKIVFAVKRDGKIIICVADATKDYVISNKAGVQNMMKIIWKGDIPEYKKKYMEHPLYTSVLEAIDTGDKIELERGVPDVIEEGPLKYVIGLVDAVMNEDETSLQKMIPGSGTLLSVVKDEQKMIEGPPQA